MTAAAQTHPSTRWIVVGRWPAATPRTKINTPDLTGLVSSLPPRLHGALLQAIHDEVQQTLRARRGLGVAG